MRHVLENSGFVHDSIPSTIVLRLELISFLKKYMYLNGSENNFHLIDHTVFMTDQCDIYNYACRICHKMSRDMTKPTKAAQSDQSSLSV